MKFIVSIYATHCDQCDKDVTRAVILDCNKTVCRKCAQEILNAFKQPRRGRKRGLP